MTVISPRVTEQIAEALAEIAGTKNAGAVEAVEAYIYIRRATWQELKGRFTKAEATALADMYNGVMLTPRLQVQQEVIRAQIEDSEKYDSTCTRHGADMEKLLEKTDALTAAQVWVLQQEIVRAWTKNIEDPGAIDGIIKFLS